MYVKLKLLLLWLADAFNMFDGMRERYVSRIINSKCFELFDIYTYIIEVNTLDVYRRITFTKCISWKQEMRHNKALIVYTLL
jgi:hypothetical protein